MNGKPVVVLDLDGVIIKSNFVKHRAMLALFADHPEKLATVDAYILANGGVARRDKLVAILETIVGVEATPERLAQYLAQYAKSLEASLAVAPVVEGVPEFIARGDHTLYVSSTAPEEEVHDQLVRNELLHSFASVYGSRTPKAKALSEVVERHRHEEVVFFGDSLGDLDAAREAGVAFVGVTNERDNFKGLAVVKIADFGSTDAVDDAMRAAIRMHPPRGSGHHGTMTRSEQMQPAPPHPAQPRNPLHGMTLEAIVRALEAHYGWADLAERIPVRCFSHDPSVKSSLKFLRKTPWAREKVEGLYLFMLREERRRQRPPGAR